LDGLKAQREEQKRKDAVEREVARRQRALEERLAKQRVEDEKRRLERQHVKMTQSTPTRRPPPQRSTPKLDASFDPWKKFGIRAGGRKPVKNVVASAAQASDVHTMVAVNKKRDTRSVADVMNERLVSQPPKSRSAQPQQSTQPQPKPTPRKRRHSEQVVSSVIQQLFRYDKRKYATERYSDEDSDDMEATTADLRREEQRSLKIAKEEDEREAELERQEMEKRKLKQEMF
jgi:protein SPT2